MLAGRPSRKQAKAYPQVWPAKFKLAFFNVGGAALHADAVIFCANLDRVLSLDPGECADGWIGVHVVVPVAGREFLKGKRQSAKFGIPCSRGVSLRLPSPGMRNCPTPSESISKLVLSVRGLEVRSSEMLKPNRTSRILLGSERVDPLRGQVA